MAMTSFKVGPDKALVLAECQELPKVMIIAGPNGVGKTTLLYLLSKGIGATVENSKLIYQPPHRMIRRNQVQRGWLGGGMKLLEDVLSSPNIDGFPGMNNSNRQPDNVDEAGSAIKHVLGKIENRRQAVLARLIDNIREKKVEFNVEDIPDVYASIKNITRYLLPHLNFKGMDFSNDSDIKCSWERTDQNGAIQLDIDDLSSGEKSILILFLPLVENEITQQLDFIEKFDNKSSLPARPVLQDRVVIIDEPELHLHPQLQSLILTYMRAITQQSNVQFILSTHSPTILDQALDYELYLLSPADDQNTNQLKRVASNVERLELLKQLGGNSYFLTTGRSVLCVEGEASSATPTDVRLLATLYPRATAYTMVPIGGKGNLINTVKRLRENLPAEFFKINVFGLVDADRSAALPPGVFKLPVCMIENLLLEPQSILSYLRKNGVEGLFKEEEDVKHELNRIATSLREEEISLRIQQGIRTKTVRISGTTVEEVKASLEEEIKQIQSLMPEEKQLQQLTEKVTEEIDKIISGDQQLVSFRGKIILKKFYSEQIQPRLSNKSFASFCYELAQEIASKGAIEPVLKTVFDQIDVANQSLDSSVAKYG